ncbi:NAD-dependent malic enzyme [Candidatus Peregrinibacteria bacterium]|nr:NAD-dependent malic enzyme [Candidatus Peregrinibacteria bacterium]
MRDFKKKVLEAHKKYKGKLEVISKVPLNTKQDMSFYYTPGVAEPCIKIAKNQDLAYQYTSKGHTIAVVTDGSAVLGLGNIGALAGLPVMEGKCVLFKKFGGVDAVPICINTQNVDEFVDCVKKMASSFGGINLEDISAPRCFEIEEKLIRNLDIPVFHDDQHGTAIVCLAGLINALKVVGKNKKNVKVVISGAGAAGIAISKLLLKYGFRNIILQDSRGLIYEGRGNLNEYKKKIAKVTNRKKIHGHLEDVIEGTDIFIGVSKPNILKKRMVKRMSKNPIIFAMSNPDPEIHPKDAKSAGAKIIATGRSDYPNQINNVLVFPGIFKGALEARFDHITDKMKISSAEALARLVKKPSANKIIPGVFEKGVSVAVANAVKNVFAQ